MKKMLMPLVVCFMFVIAGKILAADAPKAGNDITKVGLVTKVDADKNTLDINRIGDNKAFTFIVTKEMIKDVKVGNKVEVVYHKDAEKNRVASKVTVLPNSENEKSVKEEPKKSHEEHEKK